jgi:hypothetical protein
LCKELTITYLGASGVIQVWTRSPSGEERQISVFGTDSYIEALGETGEVIYRNAGRRYLATSSATAVELDFTLGHVFWQDGEWYVSIGRSLFKVVLPRE